MQISKNMFIYISFPWSLGINGTVQRQASFTFFPLSSQNDQHGFILSTKVSSNYAAEKIWILIGQSNSLLLSIILILSFLYLSRLQKTSQFFQIMQYFWDRWKKKSMKDKWDHCIIFTAVSQHWLYVYRALQRYRVADTSTTTIHSFNSFGNSKEPLF